MPATVEVVELALWEGTRSLTEIFPQRLDCLKDLTICIAGRPVVIEEVKAIERLCLDNHLTGLEFDCQPESASSIEGLMSALPRTLQLCTPLDKGLPVGLDRLPIWKSSS